MSKPRTRRRGRAPAAPARPSYRRLTVLALLALAAVVAVAIWMERRPDPELQRLVGRWQRADGSYVLQLTSVDPAGTLVAAYFNPGSIHVARAMASRQGTTTTVFVELRDVNYPGSTYSLVYDPGRDVLEGTYFQALEQQRFEVAFTRLR